MPKMPVSDLAAMLAAQKLNAMGGQGGSLSSELQAERQQALAYYMGDVSADMPAQDGRSKAVSTDVADTVEGLLPNLMDIFAGSDEVVRFEPVGPEDEDAAQQETDYINHVFMQQNGGFMVLYSMIKDGLLSKTGLVKVWWEEAEQEERETYYDLDEEQFAALAQAVEMSNGAMKIVAHSTNGDEPDDDVEEAGEAKEAAGAY